MGLVVVMVVVVTMLLNTMCACADCEISQLFLTFLSPQLLNCAMEASNN